MSEILNRALFGDKLAAAGLIFIPHRDQEPIYVPKVELNDSAIAQMLRLAWN